MKDSGVAEGHGTTRCGVLMVVTSLGWGGAERQMALLCRALDDEWRASVVALTDGPYRQILDDSGVPVRVLHRAFRWDIRPALTLWGILSQSRPRVVHAWGWMSVLAAWAPCRVLGIPLVNGSIRSGRVPTKRGLVSRLTSRMGDVVIANSAAGLEAYRVGAARGRVVHNGFDFSRVDAVPRERDLFADRRCVVVMTGRMTLEKHYSLLIDAARVLSKASPGRWRFIALGDGPERERLERASADMVAHGVLEMPSPTREVIGVVRNADIGVLLTSPLHAAEGVSNSIMEYMACGLPVVCSASGGNRELVIDSETGFVVAPGSLPELVEKLSRLEGDHSLARRMGEAGESRIRSDFDVGSLRENTVRVYGEATEKRRAQRPGGPE